jgi:concentrative nucleoside transporter, CNT family
MPSSDSVRKIGPAIALALPSIAGEPTVPTGSHVDISSMPAAQACCRSAWPLESSSGMTDLLRGLAGLLVLVAIGIALSQNRRAIQPRVVLAALATQVAIGALILFAPWGRAALGAAATGVNRVLEFGNKGIEFLFGPLVTARMFELFGEAGFVFAFRVLPAIIYVSALIAVLYHLGIMRWIILGLGLLMQKLVGVSKIESFSAVTTIFLGQSEMPAALRPFASKLRGPELFAIMTSGMAAVAGSTLAGYAGLGVRLDYLLAASFMAIPGGLLFAKILCPSVEPSPITVDEVHFEERPSANVIEAAAAGAAVGLRVAVNVGAMLIAFIGLIALLNGLVSGILGWFGYPSMNLETLMGYAFAPLAWLIGVPWEHAGIAGNLIGQKLILNEFVGYASFAPYLKAPADVTAAGFAVLDPKTIVIVSFALCGFANLSSIAILAGGFGAVAPPLRAEVARYGLRVVAAATLSNLASATIAGMFISVAT